ncbi:MAG: hypothetical protein QW791_04955 [Candidatus Bathyarchaeia archaeon]
MVKKLEVLLLCFIAITLFFSPMWLRLNFELFSFGSPDSLDMLPNTFWLFIIILLVLLSLFTYVKNNFSLIVIVCTFLFTAFSSIQWPTIFGWDQFLHTATADSLTKLTESKISGYTLYGIEYPGCFALLNFLKSITGLDYIILAIILSLIIKLLTLILIYLISKGLIKGKLAQLTVALFILGNFRFVDYFQFSPQALAFPLFLMLIILLLKPASRNQLATMMVLVFVIIISHPFTSVLMLATFLGIYIVQRFWCNVKTHMAIWLFFLCIVVWLSWQIHVALNISLSELTHLMDILKGDFSVTYLINAVLTFGRGIQNVFLLRYKQIFLAFLAIGTIVGCAVGFKERKARFFIGVLLGALLFCVALTVLSEPPSRIWLDRAILLGLLAPIILTVYAFTAFRRSRKLALKILPYFCIMLIPLSFFANFQYTYMFSIKRSEMSSINFLSTVPGENLDISSDSITLIVARHWDIYNNGNRTFSGYRLGRFETDPEQLYQEEKFLDSDLILRSFRQKVDWYYVQGIDPTVWDRLDYELLLSDPFRHKIYDSNYAQIYIRNNED